MAHEHEGNMVNEFDYDVYLHELDIKDRFYDSVSVLLIDQYEYLTADQIYQEIRKNFFEAHKEIHNIN